MLKDVIHDVMTLYRDNKLLCLNFQKDHIFLFSAPHLKPISKSAISSAKFWSKSGSMLGTRKWLNNNGVPKKTSNKRHEKML